MTEHESISQCPLQDMQSCPYTPIIRKILKRMDQSLINNLQSENESDTLQQQDSIQQLVESVNTVLSQYNHTVTDLLDIIHHLKYEHGLDDDDLRFDAAYDFFKKSIGSKPCDVKQCPFVRMHYRDRSTVHRAITKYGGVLIDTISMIHSYLLHSFDINRLTKEERKTVDDATVSVMDSDGNENENALSTALTVKNEILSAKQKTLQIGRGGARFGAVDSGDDNAQDNAVKMVDFAMLSKAMGIGAVIIRKGLSDYEKDRNQLIGDLIDVVYDEDAATKPIWTAMDIEETEKPDIFHRALFSNFEPVQLNTVNLNKMFKYGAERRKLEIDINAVQEIVVEKGMDGRLFDKKDAEHFQNKGKFIKNFKLVPNCKSNHIGRLYDLVKKWKFVEVKVEEMKEAVGEVGDVQEEEKQNASNGADSGPLLYSIGKRFYFWEDTEDHVNYIKAKYQNMKEDVLNSSVLNGLCSIEVWNNIVGSVNVKIGTKTARSTLSHSVFTTDVYHLGDGNPIDKPHLIAMKLYTDLTNLCATLCTILRRGDPVEVAQIAHWTRLLVETVQCFGTTIEPKKTYLRGVTQKFFFPQIVTQFNLPNSTTTSV